MFAKAIRDKELKKCIANRKSKFLTKILWEVL